MELDELRQQIRAWKQRTQGGSQAVEAPRHDPTPETATPSSEDEIVSVEDEIDIEDGPPQGSEND